MAGSAVLCSRDGRGGREPGGCLVVVVVVRMEVGEHHVAVARGSDEMTL